LPAIYAPVSYGQPPTFLPVLPHCFPGLRLEIRGSRKGTVVERKDQEPMMAKIMKRTVDAL
jgi:hypothetical protein